MDGAKLYDLEEGEILEHESLSPSETKSDNEIKIRTFELPQDENKNGHIRIKDSKDSYLYLTEKRKEGYMHKSLKNRLKVNKKPELISMIDLESVSSEGEYKSDEDKYFSSENKYCTLNNKEKKIKRKHSAYFYGTVEDIMSEIGETICRKSRCNYKKRKSKDLQGNLYRYSSNSYDFWQHRIFSNHLKHKKRKRKISFNDSDSELQKEKRKKRMKRKKREEIHFEEKERETKKTKVKDFDEMRRNLLEKLKKQKAEEELKEKAHEFTLKVENSEIQEVDMLIDCTNYVDNSPDMVPKELSDEKWGTKEKNGEDELDLIKLRFIALTSNKKKKAEECTLESQKSEVLEKKKLFENNREDVDLDKNELLLRAEALKTALLKKHQKRLNKIKLNKLNGIESSVGNNMVNFSSSSMKESVKEMRPGQDIGNLDDESFKENVEKKTESEERSCTDVPSAEILDLEVKINEMNESAVISNASPKKPNTKMKNKRKKRRSGSLAINVKENSEKSEVVEEDDRTLRSQLLSDLMKKKSMKDLEKKSVLMDSIQTSSNKQPFSVMSYATPKENAKPFSTVRKNLLKKVNNTPKKMKSKVTPLVPKPDIQRIIVHLGSEDSSDEDEISSLSMQKKQFSREKEKEIEGNSFKSEEVSKQENKVVQDVYERSVELLLNQTRKKIEGKNLTTKEDTLIAPEAVCKHLPPSQRLEYIKLKQKIAEREKLINQKKEYSGSSVLTSVGPQPIKISTNGKESIENVSQKLSPKFENFIKKTDHKEANSLSSVSSTANVDINLPKPRVVSHLPSSHIDLPNKMVDGFSSVNGLKTKESSQCLLNDKIGNNFGGVCEKGFKDCAMQFGNKEKVTVPSQCSTLLLPSSQALLNKLKLLLKKIKIEKTIEENYEKEISKLKNQLNLFEKKKSEQRFKIKKLGEESMKTYKAIQGITSQPNEKAMPKKGERKENKDLIDGKPEPKERKSEEKVVEEKKEAQQSKLDNELINGEKLSETVVSETSSSVCLREYQSPLQMFNKVSDRTEKVNPNVMMCHFDLLGICKDEECAYQHLRAS